MCVGTIPLGMTYKYNSKNRLPKGYSCGQETMPLGRITHTILQIAFKRTADVC